MWKIAKSAAGLITRRRSYFYDEAGTASGGWAWGYIR
nr:MAG TPA: hypothetical protein [Caudoviricetes sp.]